MGFRGKNIEKLAWVSGFSAPARPWFYSANPWGKRRAGRCLPPSAMRDGIRTAKKDICGFCKTFSISYVDKMSKINQNRQKAKAQNIYPIRNLVLIGVFLGAILLRENK